MLFYKNIHCPYLIFRSYPIIDLNKMQEQLLNDVWNSGDGIIDFHVATIWGIYLNLLQLIIIVMTFFHCNVLSRFVW